MENIHKNLPDSQLHLPKGFVTAHTNTEIEKDACGNYRWVSKLVQRPVLSLLDILDSPPVDAAPGDRYLLIAVDGTTVNPLWGDLARANDILEFQDVDLDGSGDSWCPVAPDEGSLVMSLLHSAKLSFNGSKWAMCCYHIADATHAETGADLLKTLLAEVEIKGMTLLNDNESIHISVSGQFNATNDDKFIFFDFGGSSISFQASAADANSKYWFIEVDVIRTGWNSQDITGSIIFTPRAGVLQPAMSMGIKMGSGKDMTQPITVSIYGQNTVATAGDVQYDKMVIRK